MAPSKEIQLFTNITREFLKWWNKDHDWDQYDDLAKIDKSLLTVITPEQVVTYLKILAYGHPNPGPEDIPIGQGETGLICARRAISHFLPDANKDWDPETKTGNPTRSKSVEQLIRVAGINETSAENIQVIKRQVHTLTLEIKALKRRFEDNTNLQRSDSKQLRLTVEGSRVAVLQELLTLSAELKQQRSNGSVMGGIGIGTNPMDKGVGNSVVGGDSYAYGEYDYGQDTTTTDENYTGNRSANDGAASKNKTVNTGISTTAGTNTNTTAPNTSTPQDMLVLSQPASTNHAYNGDYPYNGAAAVYNSKVPQYGSANMQVSMALPGASSATHEFVGNAVLSAKPKTLSSLWEEYEIGIGTNKAAKEFTQKERGLVRKTYSFRNSFWKAMEVVVARGYTVQQAIEKIQIAYGENASVTAVCRAISRDKDLSRVLLTQIPHQ